jgi:hypothetical protein
MGTPLLQQITLMDNSVPFSKMKFNLKLKTYENIRFKTPETPVS